jgi:hypothetical protein
MNTLCFASNLTSEEWAAWVQAIGTIIAILAAMGIAMWQSRQQHKSALALHKAEQRHSRVELAKTLLALCRNCTKAVGHFTDQMSDRESIQKIATRETYFDFGELQTLQNATLNIPLHSFPDTLVTPAMVLGATIRQFQHTVDMAIQIHSQIHNVMEPEEFEKFSKTFREFNQSLELTCADIEVAVQRVQQDA